MKPGRWTWAGIAIRDEEGNLATFEFDNPSGRITVSNEYVRTGLLEGHWDPATVRYVIELSGVGVPWEQGADAAKSRQRNVGIIGAPDAGKTAIGNDVKQLTQRPYPIGDWGVLDHSIGEEPSTY